MVCKEWLFIPECLLLSKIYGSASQAQQNYVDFCLLELSYWQIIVKPGNIVFCLRHQTHSQKLRIKEVTFLCLVLQLYHGNSLFQLNVFLNRSLVPNPFGRKWLDSMIYNVHSTYFSLDCKFLKVPLIWIVITLSYLGFSLPGAIRRKSPNNSSLLHSPCSAGKLNYLPVHSEAEP